LACFNTLNPADTVGRVQIHKHFYFYPTKRKHHEIQQKRIPFLKLLTILGVLFNNQMLIWSFFWFYDSI